MKRVRYAIRFVAMGVFCSLLFAGCKNTPKSAKNEKTAATKETPVQIKSKIEDYIRQNGKDSLLTVQSDSKKLDLKVVRIHNGLSKLGEGRYYASVDMLDKKGNLYNVDFLMRGKPGAMAVEKPELHVKNGRPYYYWKINEKDKTWDKVSVKDAGNKLKGVIMGPDEYNFTYTVTLPQLTSPAQIWIPVVQSNRFQDVQLLSVKSPKEGKYLVDPEFGNKALYLKLDKDQSRKQVVLTYHIKRREKSPYKADPTKDRGIYLQSSPLIPINNRFTRIAKSAIGNDMTADKLVQAKDLYDYVRENMSYIKYGTYGTGSALHACDAMSGNCTEFHSFYIALARAVDIPARFFIGATIPAGKNSGKIGGYHCWIEFYADGKWWPVDISEANKHPSLAEYYFGHNPGNRIKISMGRNIMFDPHPKCGGIKFFAYPVLDVNGKSAPVKTEFSFERELTGLTVR